MWDGALLVLVRHEPSTQTSLFGVWQMWILSLRLTTVMTLAARWKHFLTIVPIHCAASCGILRRLLSLPYASEDLDSSR